MRQAIGRPGRSASRAPSGAEPLDATFFTTEPERAQGVATFDDLPVDPAGDALRGASPAALLALVALLGGDPERQARPLRDATCRSFPIWDLGLAASARIAAAGDAEIDGLASAWLGQVAALDADAHEVAELLGEIRAALRAGPEGARVFALLEERVG
jgi:hypothetical protein